MFHAHRYSVQSISGLWSWRGRAAVKTGEHAKKQRRDKEVEVSGSESVVETSGSKVMRNAPLNIQYLCKRGM